MCEICLNFRCPTACPSYETDRKKPSGRKWKIYQREWNLLDRQKKQEGEEAKGVQNNKENRNIEKNKGREEREGRNGKNIGF